MTSIKGEVIISLTNLHLKLYICYVTFGVSVFLFFTSLADYCRCLFCSWLELAVSLGQSPHIYAARMSVTCTTPFGP